MNNLKKRRLGRGLEALLGATSESTVAADRPVGNLSDLLTDPPLPSSHVLSPNVASPSVSPAIVASGPVAAPVVGATLPSNHATFAGHPLDPIDPPSNLSDPGLVAPRDSSSLPAAAAARVAISASTPSVTSVAAAIESPEGAMLQLPVLDIQENPFQPRRVFSESEIASLSESLKEHDMLQPILVRVVSGKYQLISGERRLRAAIQAGWKTIPARVREADDRLVAELAIVENLQRKDLNAIEKALSFRRYLTEHQSTQEELASRLKIDRSTIANLMRILELPEVIQEHVSHNRISAGHARAILPLGEEHEQMEFCSRIIAEGWSVREAERRVAEFINRQDGPTIKPKRKVGNPQIEMLETQAKRALGTAVQIKANGRGAGRLIIHFKNDAEFQRIFEQVCQERGALAKVA
jgi:ParB family transcriptional regulator, chromosome partitioning protein